MLSSPTSAKSTPLFDNLIFEDQSDELLSLKDIRFPANDEEKLSRTMSECSMISQGGKSHQSRQGHAYVLPKSQLKPATNQSTHSVLLHRISSLDNDSYISPNLQETLSKSQADMFKITTV